MYNVSLAQLVENRAQRIEWISSDAHRELCTLKGKHDSDCQNYIRVFARVSADRMLICGTNSYKPLCRYYTTTRTAIEQIVDGVAAAASSPPTVVVANADDDTDEDAASSGSEEAPEALATAVEYEEKLVMSDEIEAQGRCPYTPQHNSTYVYTGKSLSCAHVLRAQRIGAVNRIKVFSLWFVNLCGRSDTTMCEHTLTHTHTRLTVLIVSNPFLPILHTDGQLYSATVADFSGADPLIYRETQRTEQYDLKQLNQPDFVSAVERNGYVLFFFREIAMEYMNCGKAVYSRVARVCKNDRGGPYKHSDRWTTFLKARLNCSMPGDYPFYFDEVQATSAIIEGMYETASSRRQAIIYAVFTTPPNAIPGSAICAFRAADIMDAFEGRFKSQSDPMANWLPVADDQVPEPRPGRCVEDSRTLPTLTAAFARRHTLMEQAVGAMHGRPLLTRVNLLHRFTAIAVDAQLRGLDGQHYDVLFVGTDNGRVIKLVHLIGANDTAGAPLVISETQVLPVDQAVRELSVSRATGTLIVIGAGQVASMPLHHCRRMSHCHCCVAMQDPYCAWDVRNRECAVVASSDNSLKPIHFLQRLQPVDVDLCRKHGEMGPAHNEDCYQKKQTPAVLTTRGTLGATGRSLPAAGNGNVLDNDITVTSIDGNVLTNEINRNYIGDGVTLLVQPELGASSAEASGRSEDEVLRAGMSSSSIVVIACVLFVAGLTMGVVIARLRAKFGPCYSEHRNQINA